MRIFAQPVRFATSLVVAVAPLMMASAAWADGHVEADVSLTPAGNFTAKIDKVDGTATQAGDTVKADKIVAHLKSMTTGLTMRDKHGKEKYLEVEKYPDAVLTKAVGKGGKGTAHLAMHGAEKDVTGTYKVDGGNLVAEFPIKLSDFNINGIKYMGVGVDDDVKIHVTVPIAK